MNTHYRVNPIQPTGRLAAKWLAVAFFLLGAGGAFADPLSLTVAGIAPDGKPVATPVADYRWTIEEDATKLSVPGQPATAANYSFSFHTSYMPVVAAGRVGTERLGITQDPDVARLYAEPLPGVCSSTSGSAVCLDPAKRYYISVAADGFQMGGAPVVFDASGAKATVYVNQYPVPTAQLSVFAFNDNSPLNGAPDLPQEVGLKGFTVQLFEAGGTYGQSGGRVSQDGFGNPLGTTYKPNGDVLVKGAGIVLTDANGVATIKNLFPAKYTVVIVPPVGSDWHQTSTIEGTVGSDAWVKNNEPAFFQEFGPPGHHVFIGFTKSGCVQGVTGGRCTGLTGGSGHDVTGRVINIHNSRTPNYSFEKGAPVPACWVGLNETNGDTRTLFTKACNKDSTFTIPNVPAGTYELVIWDEPLDMIIGSQIITVGGSTLALGDLPIFSWFARYQGRVFQDLDGTGLPFFAEAFTRPYIKVDPVTGLETEEQKNYAPGELKPPFGEGIASNIRFRDGSIYQSVVTKKDGTFAFTELFPFFNWMVAEIDYARFKATGATMITDAGGVIDPAANATKLWPAEKGNFGSNDAAFAYDPWTRLNPQLQRTCSAAEVAANKDADGKIVDPTACFKEGDQFYRNEQGVTLLEGMQTFLGQTNHIEWGKQPYAGQLNGAKNENGGIAGIVHYAITRAEDDPRFAAAENWEPGIPRVQINLFLDCDGDGKIDKPSNDGTGMCAPSGLSGTDNYVVDLPDVDNYPFCWRDPESCGLTSPQKGPEDVKRSRTGSADTFSYGDVFSWGGPNATATGQLATGLGKTDGWDDAIPTDCIKPGAGAVSNGATPFKDTLDCFDGLYNFNQLRPAVFDGGYAFGRVAGQAELPMLIGPKGKGTYIVEAVAPTGYLHQGNGDKNVVFGDELQASTAALPFECVGKELPVPAKLTLFSGEENPNAGAPGKTWRKCDMKAVPMVPGTNPAPDFFMFTEAPVAGHGVGFILDDTATEFNRFAPTFGEKYAPPHLPISIQDWTGREISRVYSDQFGSYNFLTPSSFTINPPFPSGVMPNMMVSCMNHPGPIDDTRQFLADGVTPNPTFGKKIIDPFFNRKYTQFCYTLQYLPGKTTYLDTPVLPIAAFASVEKNPLDCECNDKTPAIYSVNNGDANINGGNNGPWVPSSGGTLTIVSAGTAVEVPNPAYDPSAPGSLKFITRDYGFGSSPGTVTLGTKNLVASNWTPDLITVVVPANTPSGQLTITRKDSGKESVVGLTVHVGGTAPIVVPPGGNIQAVIDASTTPNGALITIPPGTYNEYVILDKRVRLQGWGAYSVTINASKSSAGGLAAWRALLNKKIDARCGTANGSTNITACPRGTAIDPDTGAPTIVAGNNRTFDPLPGQALGISVANNEPILFGADEGAGVLVVGKASGNGNNPCANTGFALGIDGITVTGSDSGGGILASGYDCNLRVSNNRIVGNYGSYGGGIRVGHTALVDGDNYAPGFNHNVVIDHNWVSENGASEVATGDGGSGGITMANGSNNYFVSNNYVCGNFSMSDGGGMSHVGLSGGTNNIVNNKILLNQTFNQSADPTGGGLFVGGQIPLAGGTASGTGNVNVDRNLIQYNHAGAGAGGGVSITRTFDDGSNNADKVILTNNMIVNNVSAYAGGGVAVSAVTKNVRLVNNTVASNNSTATNRQSFPAGPKVQSIAQIGGIAQLGGGTSARPTLLNNIVWGNKSFIWSIDKTTTPETTALSMVPGFSDLGIVGSATPLNCTSCKFSAEGSNIGFVKPLDVVAMTDPDQPVVLAASTILQTALTFDEGGNFINVILSPLTLWGADGALRADYHIQSPSTAINAGTSRGGGNNGNFVPAADFDGQSRPANAIDIGADELAAPAPTISSLTPASGLRPSNGSVSYAVILIGTNLTGATLNESSNGFGISSYTVVSPTQINATVTVSSFASPGSKVITVTGAGGTASVDFSVLLPPAPTITGISPSSGVRPQRNGNPINYAITLTGTNLTGASLTENSQNFGISNIVVTATQITAVVTLQSNISTGNKALTVTGPGGVATTSFRVN